MLSCKNIYNDKYTCISTLLRYSYYLMKTKNNYIISKYVLRETISQPHLIGVDELNYFVVYTLIL